MCSTTIIIIITTSGSSSSIRRGCCRFVSFNCSSRIKCRSCTSSTWRKCSSRICATVNMNFTTIEKSSIRKYRRRLIYLTISISYRTTDFSKGISLLSKTSSGFIGIILSSSSISSLTPV